MYLKFKSVTYVSALLTLCVVFSSFIGAQTQQTPPTQDQIKAKVQEYMDTLIRVDGFSGTILVARDGKPIVSKGYGMANIELGVPNSPEEHFPTWFDHQAIHLDVDNDAAGARQINVSDPMCKYIADCPDTWKPITIKHLLTHTSGITNYTAFPDFAKTTILPITTTEMTTG